MPARTTFENQLFDLFNAYFAKAEKYRRWNVYEDIPWHEAKNPDADVAKLVESFYAVELYLPDYVRHIMGMVRKSRGRAWFQANWGYEEMKHSMALEKWLLASGARTHEELEDFEGQILDETWTLHYGDEQLLSLCYTVLQEFATGLTYRRLKEFTDENGKTDAALSGALSLLHRDEIGHFNFFKDSLKLYMDLDRDRVLEAMTHVLMSFHMPAADLIPGWKERDALIKQWDVMTDRVFLSDVVKPVMKTLGVDHQEMRAVRKRLAEQKGAAPKESTERMVIALAARAEKSAA
jgi:acyl-[acyl-carrier-protein] desaturase